MQSWKRLFFAGLALAIMAPLAGAQEATTTTTTTTPPKHPHSINARQRRQQKRIAQGVNSGQLTAAEAARLEKQEAAINAREQKMRESGGKFTKGERMAIQKQQNRVSRRIYKQKHDRQTAH